MSIDFNIAIVLIVLIVCVFATVSNYLKYKLDGPKANQDTTNITKEEE